MTSKTRLLNTRAAGGVLTFAPTLAIDLFNNFSGNLLTDWHFNGRQFVIEEFTNQSGNLVGFAVTAAVGIALGSTAPLLVVGLGLGIFAQVAWNASGMSNRVGSITERVLGR